MLEGEVTIVLDDGAVLELHPGDAASFAPGSTSAWRVVRTPVDNELSVLS